MIQVYDAVVRAASLWPERTAISCGEASFSWRQHKHRIDSLAAGLQQLGIGAGDRVAWLGFNAHQLVECYFAPSRLGAMLVPINYRLSEPELLACLADCTPRVLIADDAHIDTALQAAAQCPFIESVVHAGGADADLAGMDYEALLADGSAHTLTSQPAPDSDNPIVIFYTGGTTGSPKGAMMSHLNLWTNALGVIGSYGFLTGETHLLAGPMFHAAAGARVFSGALIGAHTVLMPSFDPLQWLQLVQQHEVKTSQFVPTMMSMLLDHPAFDQYDLSSLRLLSYGAAPMPLALLQRSMKTLPAVDFCQGFGMSECGPVVCVLDGPTHRDPAHASRLESAGRPLPYVAIKIVDEKGNAVPTGQAGEVVVQGPNVMKGYWNRPEQTAQVLQDGWYRSGDGGYLDDDGFLFLAGRIKDMIISGGENIYPLEIENVLSLHPAVRESAIIGIPSEKWGESVHAIIRLNDNTTATADELIDWCRARIAHYKCPRSVSFRELPMPLTSINKVRKSELRKPFWRSNATGIST